MHLPVSFLLVHAGPPSCNVASTRRTADFVDLGSGRLPPPAGHRPSGSGEVHGSPSAPSWISPPPGPASRLRREPAYAAAGHAGVVGLHGKTLTIDETNVGCPPLCFGSSGDRQAGDAAPTDKDHRHTLQDRPHRRLTGQPSCGRSSQRVYGVFGGLLVVDDDNGVSGPVQLMLPGTRRPGPTVVPPSDWLPGKGPSPPSSTTRPATKCLPDSGFHGRMSRPPSHHQWGRGGR